MEIVGAVELLELVLEHAGHPCVERIRLEHVEALVLRVAGYHQIRRENLAKRCGKRHAAFGVHLMAVRAVEIDNLVALFRHAFLSAAVPRLFRCMEFYPTSPHFATKYAT